jgi:hypothetical protein
MRELSKSQCTVPGSDFAVENSPASLMRAGDKMFRDPLADILWSAPRRPIAEVIRLGSRNRGSARNQYANCNDFQKGFHQILSPQSRRCAITLIKRRICASLLRLDC